MNQAEFKPQTLSLDGLNCPCCQGVLLLEPEKIKCTSCDFEGAANQGILDLRCGRLDYYFNPVPRPEMKELVKPAERSEWPKIIRSFMTSVRNNPDWLDNLVVDGRYAWKMFLSLPEDATLLDLGCGLGNLVHNLAPQVDKVYALDLTWERLEFARLRCSLFNANDKITYIAGGDGTFLPFPDNSLDCVTLSGVLEWIPDNGTLWDTQGGKFSKALKMIMSFFGTTNPRKIQIEFLREIRRVLKPQGQLFIGIENRLNHEYFLGRPDHHSALLYGSLMPRFLANLYSIFKRRNPYRTYTYSLGGYRRLLKKAGFSQQSYLGLLDGYSKLKEILNIDVDGVPWRGTSLKGVKDKLKHHKMFVPAYGIIASQEKIERKPLISDLITEILPQLAGAEDKSYTVEQLSVTGKDKAVLTLCSGASEWIIKIPFTEYGENAEANGVRVLSQLSKNTELVDIFPLSILSGKTRGLSYFVESKVQGNSLSEQLSTENRDSFSSKVFSIWQRMANVESLTQQIIIDSEAFEKLVASNFEILRSATNQPEKLDRLLEYLKESLLGCQVRVGLLHGDFSVNNILIEPEEGLKLIDWATAQENGLSVIDIINYMDSVERTLSGKRNVLDTVELLLTKKWPNPKEYEYLVKALELSGFNPDKHQTMVVILYWAHHVCEQLNTGMAYNNLRLDRYLDDFLNRVSEIIVEEGK